MSRWLWLGWALVSVPSAWAFCGFYVAQEPNSLFNQSSKVVLLRDGDRTVMTMANDIHGDAQEFGLVVPVPTVIEQGMVTVGDAAAIDRLDQYSVPRLARYVDRDPCAPPAPRSNVLTREFLRRIPTGRSYQTAVTMASGVTVERRYSVDEFDIEVVTARTGATLARWLEERGYAVPAGASSILDSYLRQDMHFFLAKVDAERHAERDETWVRPLTVRYESPRFGVPIRLGTVNARGAQDLLVYVISEHGRVETTNYRTVRMATNLELPFEVAEDGRFAEVYQDMFDARVRLERMRTAMLELAWPLNVKCDPCSGDVPTPRDLLAFSGGEASPWLYRTAFLTRLHLRYDAWTFPEDPVFQETPDRRPWQVRFTVHQPYTGPSRCEAYDAYAERVQAREEEAARTLAWLTGTP